MTDVNESLGAKNSMGCFVGPFHGRDLAPEFSTAERTTNFIPDPEADQRHVLPVDIEAMRRHRDGVRGLDSSVTPEIAYQAHQEKIRKAAEDELRSK